MLVPGVMPAPSFPQSSRTALPPPRPIPQNPKEPPYPYTARPFPLLPLFFLLKCRWLPLFFFYRENQNFCLVWAVFPLSPSLSQIGPSPSPFPGRKSPGPLGPPFPPFFSSPPNSAKRAPFFPGRITQIRVPPSPPFLWVGMNRRSLLFFLPARSGGQGARRFPSFPPPPLIDRIPFRSGIGRLKKGL